MNESFDKKAYQREYMAKRRQSNTESNRESLTILSNTPARSNKMLESNTPEMLESNRESNIDEPMTPAQAQDALAQNIRKWSWCYTSNGKPDQAWIAAHRRDTAP